MSVPSALMRKRFAQEGEFRQARISALRMTERQGFMSSNGAEPRAKPESSTRIVRHYIGVQRAELGRIARDKGARDILQQPVIRAFREKAFAAPMLSAVERAGHPRGMFARMGEDVFPMRRGGRRVNS